MINGNYNRHRIPVGFSFLDSKTTAVLQNTARNAQAILETHGFQRIMPPSIDYPQTFEVYKNNSFFSFTDQNGDQLALRNDVTVQVIKGFAHQLGFENNIDNGCRLYYTVPVFSNNKKTVPPLREIYQLGAEIIGGDSRINFSELIHISLAIIREITAEEFCLLLGDVSISHLFESALQVDLADIVAEKNVSRFKELLLSRSYPAAAAQKLAQALLLGTCENNLIEELRQMLLLLPIFSSVYNEVNRKLQNLDELADDFIKNNTPCQWQPLMAKKTSYYSGMVFEIYLPHLTLPPLRGGCYDTLMEQYADFSANATGFAIDLSLVV